MNEFKSGDVVVHPKYGRGIVQGSGWWVGFVSHEIALTAVAADLRHLVVIDPEDREQVERFAETHHLAVGFARWNNLHPNTQRDRIDIMQATLRGFAEPETPKPEEPTGLGAVVEDADGLQWVRIESPPGWWWWRNSNGETRWWPDIDAVRSLSEGVQP